MQNKHFPLIFSALVLHTNAAMAQYTPWVDEDYPMNLYWGDTHVHSAYSMDANTMGNTALTPDQAYRFARGEAVRASTGMTARLRVPLDFLVVSDHAEQLGIMFKLREGDPRLLADPVGRKIYDALVGTNDDAAAAQVMQDFLSQMGKQEALLDNPEVSRSVWQESIATADKYNDPGKFTSLIGYEWTSMPAGSNLHRVVVYADDASRAGQRLPLSSTLEGQDTPEALWDYLASYEEETGGRALAIPHNGNLSNGLMFQPTDSQGRAIDSNYAERRMRWEPVVEMTQIKGDGETHPLLSPDDEFADFETWDAGNFAAIHKANKKPDMLKYEYARSALKLGLKLQVQNGGNPYRFGMIGSTDAHTALATAAEDNFWGKATITEPGTERTIPSDLFGEADADTNLTIPWRFTASGYAAVWAEENTREAIFNALQRKEVYATTGSRIGLRFFGGWDFSMQDAQSPNLARRGYQSGVPMGGDLGKAGGAAPGFMVLAIKDPHAANLDRIQIVKGWLDKRGNTQEKVYNVAVSDDRRIDRRGKVKSMQSTIQEDGASYLNNRGAAQLATYWEDPDFEQEQHAFYYARVLEITTPRWSEYDRSRLDAPLAPETPRTVQDRAYSSPIWYTPDN